MVLQSAAIPFRYDEHGEVQILLVTSRKKGRWVLPKGHVRHGMVPHSSAAKEAFEEAGVIGRTETVAIASYVRRSKKVEPPGEMRVDVFPMAVTTEAPVWPEMQERKRKWATVREALKLVCDDNVRNAVSAFDALYNCPESTRKSDDRSQRKQMKEAIRPR